MKPRLSLRALLQKLFRRSATRPAAPARKAPPVARAPQGIEPLEGRIAPAILLNASTLTFIDLNGDNVAVKFSRDLFNPADPNLNTNLEKVFIFSAGKAHGGAADPEKDVAQQLQVIDLTKVVGTPGVPSPAAGVSVTVTATKNGDAGDNLTDIGAIEAGGLSLRNITIAGDLGQIDAGSSSSKVAIKSLNVQSFGKNGITTQPTAGDAADKRESRLTGSLGSLKVAGDFEGHLRVLNGTALINGQSTVTAFGSIGAIDVGGSIKGLAAVAVASDNTGLIDAAAGIGTIRAGSVLGGGGRSSGAVVAGAEIGAITITGDVKGGDGFGSGSLTSRGKIGEVNVLNVLGGKGESSGSITAAGALGPVTIGMDLTGGDGASSGVIKAGGTIKGITVFDDITGGAGMGSGVVSAGGALRSAEVLGDIVGVGVRSGGLLVEGKVIRVNVGGSIIGGAGAGGGFVVGRADVEVVKIFGNVEGGAGDGSAVVSSGGALENLVIHGTLTGGGGDGSGSVASGLDFSRSNRTLESVTVGNGVIGGEGSASGSIVAHGKLVSATIGSAATSATAILKGGAGEYSGALFGHSAVGALKVFGTVEGGAGDHSGSISGTKKLGLVEISGSLTGGAGDLSGSLFSRAHEQPSGTTAGNIGSVIINGSVAGASGAHSGSIEAQGSLGSLKVAGGLSGTGVRAADAIGAIDIGGALTDSVISARGQVVQGKRSDLAIETIRIGNGVSASQILAGYGIDGAALNPDAQIGSVRVTGNWAASSLVAGIADLAGDGFGSGDDAVIGGADSRKIISRIASVVITGTVSGTSTPDHTGFVAQQILSFRHGSTTLALNPNAIDAPRDLDDTNDDATVREIAPTVAA